MSAVIFTDLDGTLIDHDSYDAAAAMDALRNAQDAGIPICICSSKTRKEIIYFRDALRIADPFIYENGAAVFVPEGYFQPGRAPEVIELGTPYYALVAALRLAREELGVRLRGFHEISYKELSTLSGLSPAMARFALEREYDEPFWFEDDCPDIDGLKRVLGRHSLNVVRGGRFHHVIGDNNKGKAVEMLSNRFRNRGQNVVFAGLGDSPNDIPMLQRVDIPILVRSQSGSYDDETRRALPLVRLADGIGPHGWNSAVNALLAELR
jgi:mannosyl-3-phosphoglycerate phosphatase